LLAIQKFYYQIRFISDVYSLFINGEALMSGGYYPKDLFCSAYSEGGELYQFAIKIRNTPGAIAEVANLLSSKGINILHGFHTACPGKKEAVWGFFADLKGLNEGIESLIKEIESLESTLEVKFSRPIIDGLVVDELHFPIMVLDERSMVMKVKTVAESFNRLYEKFGSGAGFILYEMGMAAGENKVKSMSEKYDLDKLTVLRVILAERAAKGWGIPRIERFNEEKTEVEIKVQELFECLPFKGKYKEAKSHFFRGYLAGILSRLFNKSISVIEVECVAKGDQNCKFISRDLSKKPDRIVAQFI